MPSVPPGRLRQKLFLRALPDGLKFSVVKVTPQVPDKSGWLASFEDLGGGSIRSDTEGDSKSITYPFQVSTNSNDGLIGQTLLTTNYKDDGAGQGGKVDLEYRIEGSTFLDGKPVQVDDRGYISVSSSDWKGTERPSVSNVTYFWPGRAPVNVSLAVPENIRREPGEVHFAFAVDPATDGLVLSHTVTEDPGDPWGGYRQALETLDNPDRF